MQSKVHICAPVSLSWSTVLSVKHLLEGSDLFKVSVWERNSTYSNSMIDEADAVVFILPGVKFNASGQQLPSGLRNELSRSYAQNKKVFIAYKSATSGSFQIYSAHTDGVSIAGIQRTYRDIFKIRPNVSYQSTKNPCAEIELPKGPTGYSGRPGPIGHQGAPGVDGIEFDERLLLMM